jgi:hypothetical protein
MKQIVLTGSLLLAVISPSVAQVLKSDFNTKIDAFSNAAQQQANSDMSKNTIAQLNGMMNTQIAYVKNEINKMQVKYDTLIAKISRMPVSTNQDIQNSEAMRANAKNKKIAINDENKKMEMEQSKYDKLQTLEGNVTANKIEIIANLKGFAETLN